MMAASYESNHASNYASNYDKVFQFKALLKSNRELLQQKNSYSPATLLDLIKFDYEKVLLALAEVKSRRVADVLQSFFAGHDDLLAQVYPRVNLRQLFHVGFEIYEPMDLVVEGFNHWCRRFGRLLETDIQVVRFQRFPASAAFQKRVGATTEIMRIWLQVGDQELMLELFDIHRPTPTLPPKTSGAFGIQFCRNAEGGGDAGDLRGCLVLLDAMRRGTGLTPGPMAGQTDEILQLLFGNDPIWHYAIAVPERRTVDILHETFARLIAQPRQSGQQSCFQLPYSACVHNHNDGSYHTKLIRRDKHMELEFVNHAAPAAAPVATSIE